MQKLLRHLLNTSIRTSKQVKLLSECQKIQLDVQKSFKNVLDKRIKHPNIRSLKSERSHFYTTYKAGEDDVHYFLC